MLRAHAWTAIRLAAVLFAVATVPAQADDWAVAKSSGQVWIANAKAQPVALEAKARLTAGDLIQTGPNGRALLTRGSERILVGPNSVISLPEKEPENGFTRILQRAGSVAIEAEKKDHKHFEVETPYLAAVVKGTSFTVTVGAGNAEVRVASGKVEVADNKTGKIALVLPGQSAHTSGAGFSVRGGGPHEPMRQGPPRSASLSPVAVPKQGLRTAPQGLGHFTRIEPVKASANAGHEGVRITKAIGPLKLDISAATSGLARGEGAGTPSSRSASTTIWSNSGSDSSGKATSAASGSNSNSSASAASGAASGRNSGAGSSAASAAVTGNGNAFGLVNGGNGNAVNGHASSNGMLHGKKKN